MSIATGAEFKLVDPGPAIPEGHYPLKFPKALRHIPAHCDVAQEVGRDRYIVALGDIQQLVNYVDACGYDVYVPGHILGDVDV